MEKPPFSKVSATFSDIRGPPRGIWRTADRSAKASVGSREGFRGIWHPAVSPRNSRGSWNSARDPRRDREGWRWLSHRGCLAVRGIPREDRVDT